MPPKIVLTQADCDKNNKDYKESTNRCVKKCGPKQERDNESFKCKKRAAPPKGNTQESCDKLGKDLNRNTGRCVKKCGPRQERDAITFKCKKTAATGTRKTRKPKSAKATSPQPPSLSFDNYQPTDVRSRQPYEQTFSRKQKSPLLLGYKAASPQTRKKSVRSPPYNKMSPEYSAKPSKPLLLGYKAASPQSTKPVQTDSLLKFVKKHPAKINENELNKRMKRLQEEMQERKNSRIKVLEEKGAEKIKQEVQNLSGEMKKLDNIMDENVANNVIIEKQEEVAEKIDELENKVEQLTTSWPSPSIDELSPQSPPFQGIFTKKSRRPQPYQKFSSAPKAKKPLLLVYNKPKYNKMSPEYSPQPKKLLLLEDKKPEIRGRTRRASPDSDIFSTTESWRDDENKLKGSKQSPTQPRGRTRRKSDTPTPSPSWDVEFGNKGVPQASEKHKGNSPGWSNSPVSPEKSPKQERWWWDNQNTPSPELEESASSTPEEESPDASPPKNHKKGWLWGGM